MLMPMAARFRPLFVAGAAVRRRGYLREIRHAMESRLPPKVDRPFGRQGSARALLPSEHVVPARAREHERLSPHASACLWQTWRFPQACQPLFQGFTSRPSIPHPSFYRRISSTLGKHFATRAGSCPWLTNQYYPRLAGKNAAWRISPTAQSTIRPPRAATFPASLCSTHSSRSGCRPGRVDY